MSLGRYLSDVDGQEARAERHLQLESNPRLDGLVAAYEECLEDYRMHPSLYAYERALPRFEGLTYTARDVRSLSILLGRHQEHPGFITSGDCLSAAVAACPEDEFEIVTEHLKKRLPCLAEQNTKHLIIEGDAGPWLAERMKSGVVSVTGNIEAISPRWFGGEIYALGRPLSREEHQTRWFPHPKVGEDWMSYWLREAKERGYHKEAGA